jgi:hypothetical protein
MGATLIQPCRVSEEGLRVVKLFRPERNRAGEQSAWMTVPEEEAPANYVPAAAVIRRVQALIGITGRKACAGGRVSQM